MQKPAYRLYSFHGFTLNLARACLLKEGREVKLRPKAFKALEYLIENCGRLVSKEELIQAVWPDSFVTDNSLVKCLKEVRLALEDDSQRIIKTVPRRGYILVAEVSDESAESMVKEHARSPVVTEREQGISQESGRAEVGPATPGRAHMTRRWIITGSLIAVAALVIGISAAFSLINRAPSLTDRDTLLLADFANTTGDSVFDDTLKQALAVKLEESPFLNIFPDQQVRETLKLMGRASDERVTREVAREICERRGVKALLSAAIAKLDRNYAITLEAINAQTGETIARQVVEAEGRDQVIKALGGAATKLREKLGESLSSIQKFDAPIEQGATTSSLDAWKAFSQAMQYQSQAKYFDAIQFHLQAIEMDPDFALAYARLSSAYGNTQHQEHAIKAAEKAFELRERVSEREKFYISYLYHWNVTRDFDEQNRVSELWKSAYPREATPFTLRGINYALMGQHEKAIEEYREAIRLNPNSVQAPHNLATSFMILNRLEEAKQPSKIPPGSVVLYQIAFVEGDLAEMKRLIEVMIKRENEPLALNWQARVAAFYGRLRESQELRRRAVDLSQRRNSQGEIDFFASGFALRSATLGQCQRAREALTSISKFPQNLYTFFNTGMALALCGEVKQAQSMIDERVRQYPKDRVANEVLVPLIRAVIEIQRGHRAQAIRLLEEASRYKAAAEYTGVYQSYLLGQAYLGERRGAEAGVEFQYILDHRGQDPASPLYTLAHLGLARAAMLTGDAAKSRQAYEGFFSLWKDADPDLPFLQEAKREYEKLK